MNWTPEQLKEAEQRIQAKCKVLHVAMPAAPLVVLKPKRALKPHALTGWYQSPLERELAQQFQLVGLAPEVQYKVFERRKFRLDFAWADRKIAVLVQGNVHRIQSKFYRDCELFCLLTVAGWRYLPVSRNEIKSGMALKWTERMVLGELP